LSDGYAKALGGHFNIAEIQRYQFGTPEGAGKAQQQQGAVTKCRQIGIGTRS